jgi:hypothetical protein
MFNIRKNDRPAANADSSPASSDEPVRIIQPPPAAHGEADGGPAPVRSEPASPGEAG